MEKKSKCYLQCLVTILSIPAPPISIISYLRRLPNRSVNHFPFTLLPPTSHTHRHSHSTLSFIPLSVNFVWVPSHRGIWGNEAVYSTAKAAPIFPSSNLTSYPLNLTSPTIFIQNYTTNHWTNLWRK